ncbi:AAA family ATPase [Allorhizobium sp. BGMRC 0089]|uniref:ParA family protein n=1 Tax=Allorhizobium sonneratiae TaxID=2934936 RepID=UPI0020348C0A|nr:AAA family ATPase [Allorhizobium sonneratiae]MCM2293648.1 AAA family ATPase [Allorhizobium sonneratiae]
MKPKKHIKIALFNHKGGVSKTTSTFNIGWKLAELGRRVLLVDCDPQCNLTGLVLEYSHQDEYPFNSDDQSKPKNIRDAVAPAFDGRPRPIATPEVQTVEGRENLYLLPGHVGLSEYEGRLSIAHELSGSLTNFQNIPGALSHAINLAAKHNDIDIVLIDLSPSLGSLNQNLLMSSDGFIIPMAPDFFSGMALRSLSSTLPNWAQWSKSAGSHQILRGADYPWKQKLPKYIGSIVQNYRRRSRDGQTEVKPTRAFQKWFDDLADIMSGPLIQSLKDAGLTLELGHGLIS